jgi:hypothetical protein
MARLVSKLFLEPPEVLQRLFTDLAAILEHQAAAGHPPLDLVFEQPPQSFDDDQLAVVLILDRELELLQVDRAVGVVLPIPRLAQQHDMLSQLGRRDGARPSSRCVSPDKGVI